MTKYDRYLFIQVHSFIISSRFIMLSIYTMCVYCCSLLGYELASVYYVRYFVCSISHGICDKNRIIRATMFAKTMERVYESKTMSGGCLAEFSEELLDEVIMHLRTFCTSFVQNSFRTRNTRCSTREIQLRGTFKRRCLIERCD